jgi:phage terminase small subunit
MGKAKSLTPSQQIFVSEYLVDRNGTRAYKKAFPQCKYGTCRVEAAKLLAKPNIREEIRAAAEAQQKRTQIRADDALREAARIAFADPYYLFEADGFTLRPMHEIPIETRRMIAKMKSRVEREVPLGPRQLNLTCPHCKGEFCRTVDMVTRHETVEFRFVPKGIGLDKLFKHLGLHQEIPPLEILLASFPKPLADQVREAMAELDTSTTGQP